MRRIVFAVACLLVLTAIALGGAAAVLAQGTSTSAGDNQYVDPLTGTSSTSTSSAPPSSSSGSGSNGSPSTSNSSLSQAPSSLASGSSSSPDSSSSGTTATSAHGGTLPFTGMNVWACIAIGAGLLGTGVVLRRVVRST